MPGPYPIGSIVEVPKRVNPSVGGIVVSITSDKSKYLVAFSGSTNRAEKDDYILVWVGVKSITLKKSLSIQEILTHKSKRIRNWGEILRWYTTLEP